jgi:hypothetical protein
MRVARTITQLTTQRMTSMATMGMMTMHMAILSGSLFWRLHSSQS